MCLVAKSFPRTAWRNKTVYKLLRYNSFNITLETPYQSMQITSKTMSAPGSVDRQITVRSRLESFIDDDRIYINEGIHSFKDLKGALREMNDIDGFVIVECIIPKGTRYVYGRMYMGNTKNYVSDKLILKSVHTTTLRNEREHYMNIKFDGLKK